MEARTTHFKNPVPRLEGNKEKARDHPAGGPEQSNAAGPHLPLSPLRILASMGLVVFVAILVTELVEGVFLTGAEWLEGLLHIGALVLSLTPLFYFLWYRPLMQQMAERQHSESEVRHLSHRLLDAGEEERRKLAQDLHDEFGQKLTSLQLYMEGMERQLASGEIPAKDSCRKMLGLVSDLNEDLRRVISDLRPSLLEDLGLVMAIEDYCAEVAKQQPRLQVEFHSSGLHGRLTRPVEIVVFRVCQEALTNVAKHARATRVEVRLVCSYPFLILTVQDNGIGIPKWQGRSSQDRKNACFGLLGMRERVAAVGGTLRIISPRESGTRIRVEIPLRREEACS
jgi:signal transduction histidine kinase